MSSASPFPPDRLARYTGDIERDGFTTLPSVLAPGEVEAVLAALEHALASLTGPTIRGDEGTIYAARNILALWPEVAGVWRRPPLPAVLQRVLGPAFGLIRVLYFDKPPGQSWALPWHKDLVIAVRDNALPSEGFRKPTRKAGVPHVEAPCEVLAAMLTARIHLDPVNEENGPLRVVVGSHRDGKRLSLTSGEVRTLHAAAGDVLLIRPLVAHCSNRSFPDTTRHRRILHLEFSSARNLPDGFAWHDFLAGRDGGALT
jgi:hypothetical protein